MPTIKIFRKRDWISRLNPIEVYLDGIFIGKISHGETKEIDVTTGSHRLKVRLNSVWGSSKELEVTLFSKELRTFCVERNIVISYGFLLLLLGLIFFKRYLFLTLIAMTLITHGTRGGFSEVVYHSFIYSAIYVIGIICFFIIGRNSYFKIKDEGA